MKTMDDTPKNEILKCIGQRIRDCRKQAGLTQAQAAELAGVSPKHISRLENGEHNPHFDMIIKLASVYHVPVDAFTTDLSASNIDSFLLLIRPDLEGMSQKQLDMLREQIALIKKYEK